MEKLNVRYGPYERNVLDIKRPDVDDPTPTLIWFHGGGWKNGDKGTFWEGSIHAPLMRKGVAVVSANYRFTDTAPFPAQMRDGARAVQFVRQMADEWNLDPGRIALAGGSAGAVISLWIAFNDDLADAGIPELIPNVSTRVSSVWEVNGPTTLSLDFVSEHIVKENFIHPAMPAAFGFASMEEMLLNLDSPYLRRTADDASIVNHFDEHCPPVFLDYSRKSLLTPPDPTNYDWVHHPKFGVFLKEKMDALGVENVFRHMENPATDDEIINFLLKHWRRPTG